jgi:hypothetical protein
MSCLVVDLAKFSGWEGRDCQRDTNEIIDIYEILRVTSKLNRDTMRTKELWMVE